MAVLLNQASNLRFRLDTTRRLSDGVHSPAALEVEAAVERYRHRPTTGEHAFVPMLRIPQAPFEGHSIRRLEGTWSVKPDIKPGVKYWEIRTDQPLGRLAFYLLEPMSDDGLVAWNFLDDQLKDAKAYPILRRK